MSDMAKKIVVTGGAGFIGSNFVHYLVEKYPDYQITVVDKLTYAGSRERLETIENKVTFQQLDICDYEAMDGIIKGCDVVVHFAAESHVDRSVADPSPFLTTNILGTETLARLSLKHGVERFHHVSTDEVFGTLPLEGDDAFNEETPYSPRSPYSASKASSDHLIRAYGETYGLPYTITNCSNNYGPADSPARAVPLFITNALDDKPLPIYGKGIAIRDYLFVYDHCTSIDLAIHQAAVGSTYCVGGGTQLNTVQLAETILKVMGKPSDMIEHVVDRPGHDPRYTIDPSLIKQELDWNQSVNFEQGIEKTINWYRDNQDWWRPLKAKISLLRDAASQKVAKT